MGDRSPRMQPAVLVALATFLVLSAIAAVQQRGLTWWDPLIISVAALVGHLAWSRLRG